MEVFRHENPDLHFCLFTALLSDVFQHDSHILPASPLGSFGKVGPAVWHLPAFCRGKFLFALVLTPPCSDSALTPCNYCSHLSVVCFSWVSFPWLHLCFCCCCLPEVLLVLTANSKLWFFSTNMLLANIFKNPDWEQNRSDVCVSGSRPRFIKSPFLGGKYNCSWIKWKKFLKQNINNNNNNNKNCTWFYKSYLVLVLWTYFTVLQVLFKAQKHYYRQSWQMFYSFQPLKRSIFSINNVPTINCVVTDSKIATKLHLIH